MTKKLIRQHSPDKNALREQSDDLTARNTEIDEIIMSLYRDKAKEILTEQRFTTMYTQLEDEQKKNSTRISEIDAELNEDKSAEADIRSFIDEIRGYSSVNELDEAILNRLIDKIIVGETRVENGEKVQMIKIIYNFVGEIENDGDVRV